jgi:hypothetical protein
MRLCLFLILLAGPVYAVSVTKQAMELAAA